MASLAGLQADVAAWLKRQDIAAQLPSWVRMVETDIAQTLRARCMVARATQPVDAAFITLPVDFCSMESLRDSATGNLLKLEDAFSGPAYAYQVPPNPYAFAACSPNYSYRLVGGCIEFLPHPQIPDPPIEGWAPSSVDMAWFQMPAALVNPQDTNAVLETFYAIYLFGTCKYGAAYELDDLRYQQMDGQYQSAIFAANMWKQGGDYSGAPLRAVVRGF